MSFQNIKFKVFVVLLFVLIFLLACQAMFPVTSRVEMRGSYGVAEVTTSDNELSLLEDEDLVAIWEALMARLLYYPEYVQRGQAA